MAASWYKPGEPINLQTIAILAVQKLRMKNEYWLSLYPKYENSEYYSEHFRDMIKELKPELPDPMKDTLPVTDGFTRGLRLNSIDKKIGQLWLIMRKEDEIVRKVSNYDFESKKFSNIFLEAFTMFVTEYKGYTRVEIEALKIFLTFFKGSQPRRFPLYAAEWTYLLKLECLSSRYLSNVNLELEEAYCEILDLYMKYLKPYMVPVNGDYSKEAAVIIELGHIFFTGLASQYPDFICRFAIRFLDQVPYKLCHFRNLFSIACPTGLDPPDLFSKSCLQPIIPLQEKFEYVDMSEAYYRESIPQGLAERILLILTGVIPMVSCNEFGFFLLDFTKLQLFQPRWYEHRIRAIVYFVAFHHMRSPTWETIEDFDISQFIYSKHISIYHYLKNGFENSGRVHMLNAMIDRLRYPSIQTYYFHKVILHMYSRSDSKVYKEQILIGLMKRLSCPQPHPFGVLLTMRILFENPKLEFGENMVSEREEFKGVFKHIIKTSRDEGAEKPYFNNY